MRSPRIRKTRIEEVETNRYDIKHAVYEAVADLQVFVDYEAYDNYLIIQN